MREVRIHGGVLPHVRGLGAVDRRLDADDNPILGRAHSVHRPVPDAANRKVPCRVLPSRPVVSGENPVQPRELDGDPEVDPIFLTVLPSVGVKGAARGAALEALGPRPVDLSVRRPRLDLSYVLTDFVLTSPAGTRDPEHWHASGETPRRRLVAPGGAVAILTPPHDASGT